MLNQSEIVDETALCVIDERWHDRTVVISCGGELDMSTAPQLGRRITSALENGPEALVVDLTPLGFLASHGIGVLVAAHETCSTEVRFAVVAEGRATRRPMQLLGVTEVLSVHATLDDAMRVVST